MKKLAFALYGTQSQFIERITPLFDAFEAKFRTKIETTELSIEDAWPQLLNYTIHGGGPDIARIGTIWTSSLVSLNAPRPFKAEELRLDPPELLEVEKMILENGRSYRPYPIWVRIQNDLIKILDQITAEYLNNTDQDVLPIIRKFVDPLAQRFNLILSAM